MHRRGLAAVPSTLVSATRASHDPPPGEETHAGDPRTSTGRSKSSRLRSVHRILIEPISSGVRRTGIAHLPEPAGRKHCRVWLAPLFIKGRSDSAEPVDSISWVGLRKESRKRGIVDRSGLAGHLRGMATSRRHSTKLAGRKWTAATRVQKPKPRTAGVSASEHNRARATVEQLQAPTTGTPHRDGVGGRSASIG